MSELHALMEIVKQLRRVADALEYSNQKMDKMGEEAGKRSDELIEEARRAADRNQELLEIQQEIANRGRQ